MTIKPTLHAEDDGSRKYVRAIILTALLQATERGCQALQCTGVSFVTMGLGHWSEELADIDAAAATKLMRALADIFDPKLSRGQKNAAERARREAVRALHVATDLQEKELRPRH